VCASVRLNRALAHTEEARKRGKH